MPVRDTANLPITQLPVGPVWNPVSGLGNYDQTSLPKEFIVIHTMVGTVKGANAVFNNPANKTSANYGIGLDGRIYQWVQERFTAYANGNYTANQRAISIEHEDNWSGPPAPEPPRTDALYASSAKLVADICKFYGIPCTRQFIRKHSEVSVKATACPDNLDIERIVREANQILNPTVAQTVSTPAPSVDDDQKRALQVLQYAFENLTTLDNQRFGNIEGLTRELIADYITYKGIKNSTPVVTPVPILPNEVANVISASDPATKNALASWLGGIVSFLKGGKSGNG